MRTIAPISPTARANAIATPERIPGRMFGQHDAPERREVARPERLRRLLQLRVELDQHGLHRADDERERDEQQRDEDRPARERHVRVEVEEPIVKSIGVRGP